MSKMSRSSIKIRARFKNGVTTVKTLINHPMETGLRKDIKTGKSIPANYIQQFKCESNGKVYLNTQWGVAISKNPYLAFKYSGGQVGDILKFTWTDNSGQTSSTEARVN